ncbi:hypothetical protein RchiOBHm_Chr1g0357441 [Rosa chinensis]|uniref:Uncharacterized protein n=1 Tax=Rosa chinensis TaxID=74649 RepID=A0A2P6SHW8_ROSCH|nr:hypothetical protein RchiOBHm_Chr1g0357441 [Rosa chinensis]
MWLGVVHMRGMMIVVIICLLGSRNELGLIAGFLGINTPLFPSLKSALPWDNSAAQPNVGFHSCFHLRKDSEDIRRFLFCILATFGFVMNVLLLAAKSLYEYNNIFLSNIREKPIIVSRKAPDIGPHSCI